MALSSSANAKLASLLKQSWVNLLLSGCFLCSVLIEKHITLKALPTTERNQTLTSLFLHSDVPPDVTDLLRPRHSFCFFFFISNITCIFFFFSPLSLETAGIISCASMQSCQISPLVLFFGSVYSWDKLSRPPLFFLCWIPNTWMGFDGKEAWGGGGTKRLFPETPLRANSFWRERRCHSCWQRLSLGLKGRLGIHWMCRLNA